MTAMPMVDAHVHFSDPNRNYYPWLNDRPLIPFRYGDYSAICRPYLPDDYKRDLKGRHNVVKTVYIEAEWDPSDPIGEMDYIAHLRREPGWPNAAVGQAWLDRSATASRFWSASRRSSSSAASATSRAPIPSLDRRADRQHGRSSLGGGYAILGRLGLRFDLQTPWWHLHEAAELANRYPDIPMILLHSGLPADRGPEGIAGWKKAMAILAERPNVSAKISRYRPARAALARRQQSRHRADHHRPLRHRPLHVWQQLSRRQRLWRSRYDLLRLQGDHERPRRGSAGETVPRQRRPDL
jgi:predicted TIM-barrel fold metal-dependent hydrolase